MDNVLIDNINRTVGENDILWHLGDWAFCRGSQYFTKCKYYRDKIICKNVNLIWGNHDKKSITPLFSNCFDLYQMVVNLKHVIILCHYAMAIWNRQHHCSWHLFGHSHNKFTTNNRSIDVGVDSAAELLGEYRPFSFEEVKHIIHKKEKLL